jgi:anti-anti-sigma factor
MVTTTLASPDTSPNHDLEPAAPVGSAEPSLVEGVLGEAQPGSSSGPRMLGGVVDESRPIDTSEQARPRPSVFRGGRTGLLTPTGPLNGAAAAALVAQIRALSAACRSLIVDLRRVDYVDSQGAKALLALRDAVSEAGGRLRLVIAEGSPVERTLRLLRFDGLFPIFRRAADAWRGKERKGKAHHGAGETRRGREKGTRHRGGG